MIRSSFTCARLLCSRCSCSEPFFLLRRSRSHQALQPIRAAALLYSAADMVTLFHLITRAFLRVLTYLQGHAPSQALLSICHMEGRGLPVEHNVA